MKSLRGHYLRPVRPRSLPERIATVTVCPAVIPVGKDNVRELRRLRWAVARVYANTKGSLVLRCETSTASSTKVWDWLWSQAPTTSTLWLFGAELAQTLTLLGLWDLLDNDPAILTSYVIQDPPSIFCLKSGRRRIKIVDVANYWGAPLSSLVSSGANPETLPPARGAPLADVQIWTATQADVLDQAVATLLDVCHTCDLGGLTPTVSSLAFQAFRYRYLTESVLIHDEQEVTALERAALYGGTCECWYVGHVDQQVTVADANSLYPWCMYEFPFPRRFLSLERHPSGEDVARWCRVATVVARVGVRSREFAYPLRDATGLRLYTGRFRTTLAGPELARGLGRGDIETIDVASVYEPGQFFRTLVSDFSHWRIQAQRSNDRIRASLIKGLMNGLLGKFAARRSEWEEDPSCPLDDRWGYYWSNHVPGPSPCWVRAVAGTWQRSRKREEWYHACPAVTAYGTSYGRARMDQIRMDCGLEHVFYTDTDAVHVDSAGFARLSDTRAVDSTALGAFKINAITDEAEYRGIKNYSLGQRHVIAGLPVDHLPVAPGLFLTGVIGGLPFLLRSQPGSEVLVRERLLNFRKEYDRASVGPDGWTRPLCMREEL